MLDSESDFGLQWLFNPNSSEFLPIEEQLKQYKTRELAKTKTYATATRLWGVSRNRKRIFIAPPMGPHPGKDASVLRADAKLEPLERSKTLPAKNKDWALTELEKVALREKEIEEKSSEYRAWLGERRKLRDGLESLGLNEKWLNNKPDPSPLEQRVRDRMMEERLQKQQACKDIVQIVDTDDQGEQDTTVRLDVPRGDLVTPDIKRPPPEGLAVIAKYLTAKRQRLIDLFARADKDKDWRLTRMEFQRCMKEAGIPISSQLLSDLLLSLDQDSNDLIDYREFVHGMKHFRSDERKKVSMALLYKSKDKQHDVPTARTTSPSLDHHRPSSQQSGSHRSGSQQSISRGSSSQSTADAMSRSSSPYLLPPTIDLTERRELEPDQMIEKRKREKHHSSMRKKKGIIRGTGKVRTGNPAIDSHSMRSTLGGKLEVSINQYREARLKEYHDICKLCQKHGINLTPKLLERALLHPGDKPTRRIRSHIRQPGTTTLSQHFADPPAPKETAAAYQDRDNVMMTRSGELVMEAKHAYPLGHEVRPEAEMMNLSSGKAFVSRKVDCWMTFEEYDRLTMHLAKRYVTLDSSGVDPNAFWPGHLLDKLRLCMPAVDNPSTDSLFASIRPTRHRAYPGYNNDLKWWPTSDQGYMVTADYEQNKVYSIDPK